MRAEEAEVQKRQRRHKRPPAAKGVAPLESLLEGKGLRGDGVAATVDEGNTLVGQALSQCQLDGNHLAPAARDGSGLCQRVRRLCSSPGGRQGGNGRPGEAAAAAGKGRQHYFLFLRNASRAATAVSGKSLKTPSTPSSKNCVYSCIGSPAYSGARYRASLRNV